MAAPEYKRTFQVQSSMQSMLSRERNLRPTSKQKITDLSAGSQKILLFPIEYLGNKVHGDCITTKITTRLQNNAK